MSQDNFKLCVLVISRTRFRVNPHSIVAWMLRNSLLETGLAKWLSVPLRTKWSWVRVQLQIILNYNPSNISEKLTKFSNQIRSDCKQSIRSFSNVLWNIGGLLNSFRQASLFYTNCLHLLLNLIVYSFVDKILWKSSQGI